MPTYTYSCDTCNVTVEKIIKMEDRDNAVCNDCGNVLRRGLDRPGMVWSPTRNNGYSF